MKNKKIIFIINPVSGLGKQKGIEHIIHDIAQKHACNVTIEFTKHAGHATNLASSARIENFDIVAIVGGDGSVNEVGRALLHCETAMGIIPSGSGNGLARHFKIPLDPKRSIERIFTGSISKMDVGKIEDHIFLSTAGFGFDAKVAHEFAKQKKRGFKTYVKTVRQELFKFNSFDFVLPKNNVNEKAFMLSVANIPQFGNNFTINPNATENDGLLNCTLIKPFPKYKIPLITSRFFNQSIHKSRYFQEWIDSAFEFNVPHLFAHVDGEPINLKNHQVCCTVDRSSLNVIV